MQYKELLFLSLTYMIIPQQSTSTEEGFERYDFTKIDQCVLCAYCDPKYAVDKSKNKHICTSPVDVNRIRDRCFHHGDRWELIKHKANTNLVSILPPSNKNQSCFFNITYNNVSSDSDIINDIVLLRYRKEEAVKSKNGNWESRYIYNVVRGQYMNDYQYDIHPVIGN